MNDISDTDGLAGGPRPVVVGVDGSRESRAAAAWGAREAIGRGLPLRLVHAWVDEPLYAPAAPQQDAAKELLNEAAAEVAERHPGLGVSTALLPQTATAGLVEEAESAEMTVIGSRGHSAIVGFLLGSVGLPVIAHASRPVVLVRPVGKATTQVWGEEGDEVVVGLKDLSQRAVAGLLRFAFTTAEARGAAVRAVRAWGAPSLFGSDVPGEWESESHQGMEEREGRRLAAALEPWRLRFPGVPVIEHLRFGNASEVLLTAAAYRATLMVAGRRRERPKLGLRVGPVIHAALHHARPPVAVVPYG